MINNTLGNIFKGDKVIWMIFFFLCLISIIEVYSASSQLTYKGGNYIAPVVKHVGILVMGLFCMVVTLNIKCKYYKIVTPFLLIVSVLTLIWVYFVGAKNDAQRWIPILGFQFQPSEIAKGTLVLATAQILSAMQTENGADKTAFKYILTVSAFIIPLIMLENLSTAILLCVVIFMMMLIGRVPMAQIKKLTAVSVLLVVSVFILVMTFGTEEKRDTEDKRNYTEVAMGQGAVKQKEKSMLSSVFHRFGTWKKRFESFADKEEKSPEEVDLDGKDSQKSHACIAIASSNIRGKGPGNSEEREYLSQAFSDFIYAIIIEEMGIEGAIIVALLYIFLLFRTSTIAHRCENSFPAFLAMGLALLIVTQALFNMCVAVGLAPVTGQPLPLISKGGTSTVINCVYLGVILSISRSAKRRETSRSKVIVTTE